MTKISLRSLIITGITIISFSCQNEDLTSHIEDSIPNSQIHLDAVKTGKELDVPYTVENMDKAFKQVLLHLDKKATYGKSQFATTSRFALKSSSAKNIEITPSHYYYRFLPKDSTQYNTLINDTILDVTNIPMHLEVLEDGDVYDDPDINGDETGETFGWQYAVLPYDYSFPSHILNERLEDMYFAPELDENEPLAKGESSVFKSTNKTTDDILTVDENGEVYEYLELEALKLTNNLDEEELAVLRFYLPNDTSGTTYTFDQAVGNGYQMPELILDYDSVIELINLEAVATTKNSSSLTARRRRWSPSGNITVRDDVLNRDLPVRGAHVKVRKWGFLVIKKAYTDNNGDFRTSSTRTKRVKYAVYFENDSRKFRIKAGNIFVNAKHRGHTTYKRRGWAQNFNFGRSKFYAQVHNATNDFYDRAVNKFRLQHPNWNWLRINAQYNQDAGRHLDLNPNGEMPWIPILALNAEIKVGRLNSSGGELRSDQIYGLVTHEMTHASHYRLERAFFINPRAAGCTLQTMAESWAEGVETVVTNDRYLELNPNYRATVRFNNTRPTDLYNSRKQNEVIARGSKEEYTPIVIDLVDDFNQRAEIRVAVPMDRVRGYTLRQIQTSLENARGPHGWKENLIRDHFNATEGFVEELFDVYMYDNCN